MNCSRLRAASSFLLAGILAATAGTDLRAAGLRTDEERARDLFEKAEKALLRGDRSEASDRYTTVVRRYRTARVAPDAQFRIAEIHASKRRWVAAFDAYQDFFAGFPQSPRFEEALNNQWQIVRRMAEEHRRLRKKARKPTREETRHLPGADSLGKMYGLLLRNGRFTEHAPTIRYEMGVALYREERPKTAKRTFGELVSTHPTHHLADDAAFQTAYIDYRAVLKGAHSSIFSANLAFRDFLSRYPDSDKVPEARYCIDHLALTEANLLIQRARDYEALRKPKSALVYYEKLLEDHPQHASAEVVQRIEALRGGTSATEPPRALPAD